MFSFELQQRLHAEANRKHPNDEPLNGVHAEENCTAAEEASGAPFDLDGLGNVVWREPEMCDFALRVPLRLGHQVAEHVNERWRGVVGAGSRELRAVR